MRGHNVLMNPLKGGYMFSVALVCSFVPLAVCLLATLLEKYCDEILRRDPGW